VLSFVFRCEVIYGNFSQYNHKPTCGVVVNGSRRDALGPGFESLRARFITEFFDLLTGQTRGR
jgi:hypothetical protein